MRSCAIVTTTANALVGEIHDRMPVILDPRHYALWLGEEPAHAHELKPLLKPYDPSAMQMWPVNPSMNKPVINDVSVLDPIDPSLAALSGEPTTTRQLPLGGNSQ